MTARKCDWDMRHCLDLIYLQHWAVVEHTFNSVLELSEHPVGTSTASFLPVRVLFFGRDRSAGFITERKGYSCCLSTLVLTFQN